MNYILKVIRNRPCKIEEVTQNLKINFSKFPENPSVLIFNFGGHPEEGLEGCKNVGPQMETYNKQGIAQICAPKSTFLLPE